MQLTKPTLSLFAEDFELMKGRLSSDEIIAIISGISDMCIFGETNYQPETKVQTYFWDKVKEKFDYDLRAYRASVENGKKGGAPKGNQNARKQPKNNPENNLKTTQDITQKQPSLHFTLDNYTPDSCQVITPLISPQGEKPREKKIKTDEIVDFETLFTYWEQNKKGGRYKTAESRNRQLEKLKRLTNDDLGLAKEAIFFAVDNSYQGFTDGSRLYYRSSVASGGSKTQDDAEFYRKLEAM